MNLSHILYILIGLFGISTMVLIHELGHLIAARLCHIEVETVQFGFGPAIKTVKSKKHETDFKLGIIPFGGFCRMKGQDDLTSALNKGIDNLDLIEEGSLYSVHPIKRILTYLSGPLANILFSFLCYTLLLALPVVRTDNPSRIVIQADYPDLYEEISTASLNAGLKTGDEIVSVNGIKTKTYTELVSALSLYKDETNVVLEKNDGTKAYVTPQNQKYGILPYRECLVASVDKSSPEYRAGLRENDLILSINGIRVDNMFDLLTQAYDKHNISLMVKSKEEIKQVDFVCVNSKFNFSLKGITVSDKGQPFLQALKNSGSECIQNFFFNIKSVIQILTGKDRPSETVSGTIKASKDMGLMTAQSFETSLYNGIRMVLFLLASVNMSLAVANLLPLSAFDGGLIIISFAELFAGHTFSARFYVALQICGLIGVFGIFLIIRLV